MIYAPIMRTWSSGMEEQFYLVWPAILLHCGLGVSGGSRLLGRLKIVCLELLVASLLLWLCLSLRGQPERAFFFPTTARFWELTGAVGPI